MSTEIRAEYNQLLENIAENVDIPPGKYQQAVERYQSVGTFLEGGSYPGATDLPAIYPQGSFRLGTVVRPIQEGKEADYDIDLVCELKIDKGTTTPGEIKGMIGDRLKSHRTYEQMLDNEGTRCWTLEYAESDGLGFHLDILPSTPEGQNKILDTAILGVPWEVAQKAIAITHKNGDQSYSWKSSNPAGYADWFETRVRPIFDMLSQRQRQLIYDSHTEIFASVDDVPDQLVKTPLQRAIQILKRHRDMRFAGHKWEKEKPISMIITTLAARLYEQEGDVLSTLENIVRHLGAHSKLFDPGSRLEESIARRNIISRRPDGEWYIPNPVNPGENFADRWHEDGDKRARAFFQWVEWAGHDLFGPLMTGGGIRDISQRLEEGFGRETISKAAAGLFVSGAPAFVKSREREVPHVEIESPNRPYGTFRK